VLTVCAPHAGTYCHYAVADEDQLALLPQGVDLATAGGVPLVALTAWQALQAGQPQPGKRVLIMAASGGVHAKLYIKSDLRDPGTYCCAIELLAYAHVLVAIRHAFMTCTSFLCCEMVLLLGYAGTPRRQAIPTPFNPM
jgi:hypothetical protein